VSGRATQQAASAAARAAATELMGFSQSTATAAGQALGARNLEVLGMSATGTTITYKLGANPVTDCSPNTTGWVATPTTSTNCVKATAQGTYSPLFIQVLGVRSVSHERVAVVALGTGGTGGTGGAGLGLVPFSVCRADTTANSWIVWINGTRSSSDRNCVINSWDGLLSLISPKPGSGVSIVCQSSPTYPSYEVWIGPPPTTPAPEGRVGVNTRGCGYVAEWVAQYPVPRYGYVVVVDQPTSAGAGNTTVQVLGCRRVLLTPDTTNSIPACNRRDCVVATPQDTRLVPCSDGMFSTFQEIH
jgi:hypothetical protein